MKQEYSLIVIIGLFLTAYVLEAIVQPLTLDLATPYHYINTEFLTTYPFTTTVISVRAIALFMSATWIMGFIENKFTLKAAVSFVIAALTQLYVLQELALGTQILPLEWALSVALGGLLMLLAMVVYVIRGFLLTAHSKLTKKDSEDESGDSSSQEQS